MNLSEVFDALKYGCNTNDGTNTLFSEARDGAKWNKIRNSPYYTEMVDEVLTEADKYLAQPIKALPYSLYKAYEEKGIRRSYESEYFEHRARLNTFAIMSLIYNEKQYIEALEDIIWAICDEYTWCLPAHLSGRSTTIIENENALGSSNGEIKDKIREHKNTVDLMASETGLALAEILSLLEDKLSPLVVYRARKEITQRILEPYCELNSFFYWETWKMNWSAVCAGSIGGAALYLIKDNSILAPIINRVIDSLECFLNGFMDDGACTEGLSYWNYGFGFFVSFSALIKQRTAGKIDLFNNEKVKQISLFQQKCYMSENKVISFSDGSLTANFRPGLTHYLKNLYNEVELPENKYRAHFTDDSCFRWIHSIRDLVWSNDKYAGEKFGDGVYNLKDSQWFISRCVRDDSVICFAAKGGHNDEPHNHNDVGSFILHMNGETLLTDVGPGEYNKQYFGPERYSIFCCSSQGHSVPIINGCYQAAGREFEAKQFDVLTTRQSDFLTMDIAKAYKVDSLSSLVRKFTFDRSDSHNIRSEAHNKSSDSHNKSSDSHNKSSDSHDKSSDSRLVLQDKYEFQIEPQSVVERFVTFCEPQLISDGIVRVSGEKGCIDILFDDKLSCNIQKNNSVNHKGINENVYTIDLEVMQMNKTIELEIVFELKTL